ncbi:uncharacterized protein LTR77_005540 [Saxophila tyrrhenica]|uniref:RRM domain-containing protein n=1 Tax=Saxophila tyrrhenica TaxID=1690608 RepID=A0AAV9PBS4_9PEZI|nr:hypothetical protein LTR77_005540 [Saxophila tyrrhenica]
MSSPPPRRSTSRGRSRTPAIPPAADADTAMRSTSRSLSPARNGNRRTHSRSRSRSSIRSRSPPLPSSAKIVIEKLTRNIQQPHLREIFSTYGDITSIEMPMNTQFMTNRGIAYILFETPAHAEAAIAHMHEAQLDGTCINETVEREPEAEAGGRGSIRGAKEIPGRWRRQRRGQGVWEERLARIQEWWEKDSAPAATRRVVQRWWKRRRAEELFAEQESAEAQKEQESFQSQPESDTAA